MLSFSPDKKEKKITRFYYGKLESGILEKSGTINFHSLQIFKQKKLLKSRDFFVAIRDQK